MAAGAAESKSRLKGIRVDAGLCADCGRIARPGKYHCARCAAKNTERQRRRTLARNPSAKVGAKRCGECRRLGHCAPRCPRVRG